MLKIYILNYTPINQLKIAQHAKCLTPERTLMSWNQ